MMKKPIFVIQEHHATHLHWDLRLEMDSVLKSWAVPKEPTSDPDIKRLAILVDDHDISYATFEDNIPDGYGKGTVKIWDNGEYDLIDRKDDKIIFFLHGKKLNGEFVLVRFKNEEKNWLFFRKR